MAYAYLLAKIQEQDGELALLGLEVRDQLQSQEREGGPIWAVLESMEGASFPIAKRALAGFVQQNWPWLARYITADPHNPVILRKQHARQELRDAVFAARAKLSDSEVADVLMEAAGGSRRR